MDSNPTYNNYVNEFVTWEDIKANLEANSPKNNNNNNHSSYRTASGQLTEKPTHYYVHLSCGHKNLIAASQIHNLYRGSSHRPGTIFDGGEYADTMLCSECVRRNSFRAGSLSSDGEVQEILSIQAGTLPTRQ